MPLGPTIPSAAQENRGRKTQRWFIFHDTVTFLTATPTVRILPSSASPHAASVNASAYCRDFYCEDRASRYRWTLDVGRQPQSPAASWSLGTTRKRASHQRRGAGPELLAQRTAGRTAEGPG